jgi:hypothetical protein
MLSKRKALFSDWPTPCGTIPKVTLFADTWNGHVLLRHPEMNGKLQDVKAALQSPSYVCGLPSHNFAFVNLNVLDSVGSPLIVVVTLFDKSGVPVIATAYHSKKHLSKQPRTIWP